jgi:hypothetical protein
LQLPIENWAEQMLPVADVFPFLSASFTDWAWSALSDLSLLFFEKNRLTMHAVAPQRPELAMLSDLAV